MKKQDCLMKIPDTASLCPFASPSLLPRCSYCGEMATVVCNAFVRHPARDVPDHLCGRTCCTSHSWVVSRAGDLTIDLCQEHYEALTVERQLGPQRL